MKIYNSLSRQKQEFAPLVPREVKMYVCGVTPYDAPHLGHALSAARFAMIRNYLESRDFKVHYVQNVTDVDDKIINRSRDLNVTPRELSERYTNEYNQSLRKLGLREPDDEPRVSEYIPQIVAYVQELITKGAAYATSDGDVYFDVTKHEGYGKLSGRDIEELVSGTREDVRDNKRHALDFALWKKDQTPGASWDSPWGKGRPGWHIECSVMCNSILGPQIDIHGGGLDLIFPHHENEIAQCEAHNGTEFSRVWCHNGLMMVDGKKMSKSLGNFITIDDGIARYGVPLIMYVIMKFHYRSPVDFTDEVFRDSLNPLAEFYWTFEDIDKMPGAAASVSDTAKQIEADFIEAMDNDFNTPVALTVLATGLKAALAARKREDAAEAKAIKATLEKLGRIIGIFPESYTLSQVLEDGLRFQAYSLKQPELKIAEIDQLLKTREEVRSAKDFKRSDEIRDQLLAQGVRISDRREGSTGWQFATQAK